MHASRDVILQTPNLEAATDFYERIMGLKVFERSATLMGFDAGSFRLFVERGDAPGAVFEFHAGQVADARTRLVAAGCTVVDENPAIPRCYLRDPFGLTFNLV